MRAAVVGPMVLLGAAIVAVGCSEDPSNATGGSGGTGSAGGGGAGGSAGSGIDTDSSTDCSLQKGMDNYTANLTKKGKNGMYSFVLVQSDPGPPVYGRNIWKLKVTDPGGMPLTSGLTADVWMLVHGHPSPSLANITFDAASAAFTINPVHLSMPGPWRTTFFVNPNDADISLDSVEFFFCVN